MRVLVILLAFLSACSAAKKPGRILIHGPVKSFSIEEAISIGMHYEEKKNSLNQQYIFSFENFSFCDVKSVEATMSYQENKFFSVGLSATYRGKYIIHTGIEQKNQLIIGFRCENNDPGGYYQIWIHKRNI